jgi:hypothetical protein
MRELVRRRAGFALGILIAAAIGCDAFLGKELNPAFCAGHPDDPECMQLIPDAAVDAPPEGPSLCMANPECMRTDNTGVCDVDGMCVQCTETDNPCEAAIPDKPACTNKQCAKCTLHTQCKASNVCLPDGGCAPEAMVAYVVADGTGADCTKAAPCGTLDEAIKKDRPFVKIAVGTIADNKVTPIERAVTIFAERGGKLDRSDGGVILEVKNGADVQIFDLEITGATTADNDAAILMMGGAPKLTLTRVTVSDNQGRGISAEAGVLTMTQSKVIGNARGGVEISRAQFDITNSIVANNGGPSTPFGGVNLDQTASATYRFDFNTVTNNAAAQNQPTGVACAGITQLMTFSSNIVFDNQIGNGRIQTGGGNCNWVYSDIGQTETAPPMPVPGIGNIDAPPMFVDAGRNDFHVMSGSPVRDVGDPDSKLTDDLDGEARPQGPRRDIGADELPP